MADKQITPFQLTDQFTMDNFNQRINETNIALQSKPNPNLLDNWYFANPVNQRGQTTYTGTGYTIDRWCGRYGGDMTAVIRDGYIEISRPNYAAHLRQYSDSSLAGKTVTVSALCSRINMFFESTANGVDYANVKNKVLTGSDELSMLTFTLTVPNDSTGFCIALTTAEEKQTGKIAAAKLELGSQQTLAHQENGNWVLNEIPDYADTLARCQRYFCRMYCKCPPKNSSAANDNQNGGFISFPVTMRTNPTGSLISKEVSTISLGETTVNGFDVGGADNYSRSFVADFTADL